MISSKRWLNVGALTVILVMVWASSLWAPYHRFDYSQWDRVMNLNTKVIVLMKKGKYQEAVEPAEKVLRLTKQIYLDDPDHDNVEVMKQNLAFIYMGLGRYDEAEPLFKQILETDEALVGPNDPEVARSLINLAALYSAQGQYDKAEPLQKRALAIREKVFGPGSPPVAQSLNNLANLYNKMGRDDEARKLLTRTQRRPKGTSKLSEKIGKITPTELIQAMEEKEGIRFKVMMTSGTDDDNDPIDFKTKFSVNDDDKMYVFVYWPDRVGDHRVTVIWITPDQEVFAENNLDMTFKTADWRTWQWKKMYKAMPKGDWTFALQLDGKYLVTKKFTVID